MNKIARLYSSRTAETKANWYASVAQCYLRGRPEYPKDVIENVILETGIREGSRILEIGCGPGTATQSLAELGCSIHCVEPNRDFTEIVRRRFAENPKIHVHESSFEEYEHRSDSLDVVLAATSFHWVDQIVAFAKSASLLKADGYLDLLWNHELQPVEDPDGPIARIYQEITPKLSPFEPELQIIAKLESISQWIQESEHFESPTFGFQISFIEYSAQRYIEALQSYSPYINMEESVKTRLLQALFDLVENEYGGAIKLKYLTGYHIVRKA